MISLQSSDLKKKNPLYGFDIQMISTVWKMMVWKMYTYELKNILLKYLLFNTEKSLSFGLFHTKKCFSTSTEESSRKSKYFHEPHIKYYRTYFYNGITFMMDFLKRHSYVNQKTS